MKYCFNCGNEVKEGERFCRECGTLIFKQQNTINNTIRKEQNKCPYCGEYLNSLEVKCPSCGQDVIGKESSVSVRDFALILSHNRVRGEKNTLLRSFPIPNTKEDIFEFMVLASTNLNQNISENEGKEISEAWLAKFNQCYHKAKLLFKDEADFLKIEELYVSTNEHLKTQKQIRVFLKNIPVIIGIIIMIVAIIVDKKGGDCAIWEIIAYAVLIIWSSTLSSSKTMLVDYVISEISGVLLLVLSSLLANGSMGQLFGGLVLIITTYKLLKSRAVENN